MKETLEDKHWDILLRRIRDGKCTPFLGAGACAGVLPLGGDIAARWAEKFHYPLCDNHDLARVSQFLAVDRGDPMYPKEEIAALIKEASPPGVPSADDPHSILADLPLPVYLTTNYDDFMLKALRAQRKDAVRELCRWNRYIVDVPSVFENENGFSPSPAKPVVFHLHGQADVPESLVLTEDDYLDFLVNVARNQAMLPPRIQQALTGASLLFIGYRLSDWTFRVLFRGLVESMDKSLRRISVAVQLPPTDSDAAQEKSREYLTAYFKNTDVHVYWGTAHDFTTELRERWRRYHNGA